MSRLLQSLFFRRAAIRTVLSFAALCLVGGAAAGQQPEADPPVAHDAQPALTANEIVSRLRAEILTKPKVELVPPGTLPVSEGKARRVIDNRKL